MISLIEFKRWAYFGSFLVVLCISGCHKKNQTALPQNILQEYISRSFSMHSTDEKTKLIELATGEVKEALEKIEPSEFRKIFLDSKKEFVSLKIRDERPISEEKYSITYELTYLNKKDSAEDRVTNKKHAIFLKDKELWKIAEVQTIKTTIEHQKDVSFY
ncbi:MAG: hypothetical protein AB7F43_03215 [Bacteriovoracia bacterium]